jgi:PAS domain-containing protein
LKEAWRLSVAGLTDSLKRGARIYDAIPELSPDEDYPADPLAEFGSIEGQRHRERGIDLCMFLGLFKYYRQAFQDVVPELDIRPEDKLTLSLFMDRVFDRIEIGFCSEWSSVTDEEALEELRSTNRFLTNEKNKYLTIFESLSSPAFFLDANNCIDNINRAASTFLGRSEVPGSEYYCRLRDRSLEFKDLEGEAPVYAGCLQSEDVCKVLPWLGQDIDSFTKSSSPNLVIERTINTGLGDKHFEVQFMRMLDISGKFSGTVVVINEITRRKLAEQERESLIEELKGALAEVKRLSGLLPICSSCNKIRDDTGYWQRLESYISERSGAQFSHGLCPECTERLYPDLCKETVKSKEGV